MCLEHESDRVHIKQPRGVLEMVIGKCGRAALLQFNLRIGYTGPQLLLSLLNHPENMMPSERGKIYRIVISCTGKKLILITDEISGERA